MIFLNNRIDCAYLPCDRIEVVEEGDDRLFVRDRACEAAKLSCTEGFYPVFKLSGLDMSCDEHEVRVESIRSVGCIVHGW